MSNLTAENQQITGADGVSYSYRRYGKPTGIPVVFLQHFRGNLDNWDPALVDAIAAEREIILVDAAGVGGSTGIPRSSVAGMATDVATFIDALGLKRVDLFGFSLGGFVAQEVALRRPYMVRRLVLAGTGPEGGRKMHEFTAEVKEHAYSDSPAGEDLLFLFFADTETSKAKGVEYLGRIFSRTDGRDKEVDLATRDNQAEAISSWGVPDHGRLQRLNAIEQPTLVANGSNDLMVPTSNSHLLAGLIPDSRVTIYPDAGHGFLFQYPSEFAAEVNEFLAA
ncbi:alpha/beta hydrolase (plasmid) [Paenarthrobacter sp. OM7]|uniref:alpha/beta fold hydrolase n=1 Tax=Paenarthrobacter sp. OM7 TaxID=3041264 RepID=UPI002468F3E2|nr:alpha/beta hydrolase [Paenarthrobacter sp. OM7]WGM22917.1 alpha/beta hydrolase [Paenarthrobacter sp. OM7]